MISHVLLRLFLKTSSVFFCINSVLSSCTSSIYIKHSIFTSTIKKKSYISPGESALCVTLDFLQVLMDPHGYLHEWLVNNNTLLRCYCQGVSNESHRLYKITKR